MPQMAEATTAKEPINEKTDDQSLPRLRLPGLARASSPLPLPGAAELLTLRSPLPLPLLGAQNLLKRVLAG
jgi:hypothetical protein